MCEISVSVCHKSEPQCHKTAIITEVTLHSSSTIQTVASNKRPQVQSPAGEEEGSQATPFPDPEPNLRSPSWCLCWIEPSANDTWSPGAFQLWVKRHD